MFLIRNKTNTISYLNNQYLKRRVEMCGKVQIVWPKPQSMRAWIRNIRMGMVSILEFLISAVMQTHTHINIHIHFYIRNNQINRNTLKLIHFSLEFNWFKSINMAIKSGAYESESDVFVHMQLHTLIRLGTLHWAWAE